MSNPYDSFIIRAGLEPRDFDAIRILLGVMHMNVESNSISLYSDSFFYKRCNRPLYCIVYITAYRFK